MSAPSIPSVWPWRGRVKEKIKARIRRRRKKPTDREYHRQQIAAIGVLAFCVLDDVTGDALTGGGFLRLILNATYSGIYLYHARLNYRDGIPRHLTDRGRRMECALNAAMGISGVFVILLRLIAMMG